MAHLREGQVEAADEIVAVVVVLVVDEHLGAG